MYLGELEHSRMLLEESLSISRDEGNVSGMAADLNNLGAVLAGEGDLAAAGAALAESAEYARLAGDQYAIARAALNLAWLAYQLGESEEAVTRSRVAVTESRKLGPSDLLAGSLASLGAACLRTGDLDELADAAVEAVTTARTVYDDVSLREGLLVVSALAMRRRRHEPAAVMLGAIVRTLDELVPLESPLEALHDELHIEARDELGAPRYDECVALGATMGLDDAASYGIVHVADA